MPRVRWTELAERHLLKIRTRRLGEQVLDATDGLARFPTMGRATPEAARFAELAAVRELTIGRTVRVFYEYDPRREVVWILGMLFKGQEFTPRLLGARRPR